MVSAGSGAADGGRGGGRDAEFAAVARRPVVARRTTACRRPERRRRRRRRLCGSLRHVVGHVVLDVVAGGAVVRTAAHRVRRATPGERRYTYSIFTSLTLYTATQENNIFQPAHGHKVSRGVTICLRRWQFDGRIYRLCIHLTTASAK